MAGLYWSLFSQTVRPSFCSSQNLNNDHCRPAQWFIDDSCLVTDKLNKNVRCSNILDIPNLIETGKHLQCPLLQHKYSLLFFHYKHFGPTFICMFSAKEQKSSMPNYGGKDKTALTNDRTCDSSKQILPWKEDFVSGCSRRIHDITFHLISHLLFSWSQTTGETR